MPLSFTPLRQIDGNSRKGYELSPRSRYQILSASKVGAPLGQINAALGKLRSIVQSVISTYSFDRLLRPYHAPDRLEFDAL